MIVLDKGSIIFTRFNPKLILIGYVLCLVEGTSFLSKGFEWSTFFFTLVLPVMIVTGLYYWFSNEKVEINQTSIIYHRLVATKSMNLNDLSKVYFKRVVSGDLSDNSRYTNFYFAFVNKMGEEMKIPAGFFKEESAKEDLFTLMNSYKHIQIDSELHYYGKK